MPLNSLHFFISCHIIYLSASFASPPNQTTSTEEYEFPPNFHFAVATAAYQIEGGWKDDGRGPSIWDVGVHEHPERVTDHSNADIADDSYNRFDQDLEMLKNLGVDVYRFSISWSRILPTGDISSFNADGVKYYNSVIDKLIASSIEPMITMYHWDLPQELQEIGGLTNPLFIKYFEQYADLLFAQFGDRVKLWITFNEPGDYCQDGYEKGLNPPFIKANGVGGYLCIDHTIKAHALAFHLYKQKYYKQQKGKVGITCSTQFFYSKTNDSDIIDRGMQFGFGWIIHPIFSKSGGYPEVMINDVASNSQSEGRTWSRLPDMDDKWKYLIRGSADFLGLNYYSSRYIDLAPKNHWLQPSYDNDARINRTIDPSWKQAKSKWLYKVPQGLEDLLRWIKEEYHNPEVFVTENGWSDGGELVDDDRISYLQEHLRSVAKAINLGGCNVVGYTHWSLMDNFEWMAGYTEKFGLYYVDFNSPNRTRIPKKSASAYKTIIKNRRI